MWRRHSWKRNWSKWHIKKIKLLSKGVYVNTRTAGQAIYLQQPRASIDASPPAVRFGLGAALRRPASVDRSIL